MFGDEKQIGTPVEDMMSVLACRDVVCENKFLVCLGYGVEHCIDDHIFLDNVSTLSQSGGFLGFIPLNLSDEHTKKYYEIFSKCKPVNSIINSSICAALEGHSGNYHHEWIKERTNYNTMLDISKFTSTYWVFDPIILASKILYLEHIVGTNTSWDVNKIIKDHRQTILHLR